MDTTAVNNSSPTAATEPYRVPMNNNPASTPPGYDPNPTTTTHANSFEHYRPGKMASSRGRLRRFNIADSPRNNIVAVTSEFVGTFLFLFFAFGGTMIASNPPQPYGDGPGNTLAMFYTSLGFGVSLAINVWVFYRVTGGMFNPAVTLSLLLVGAIGPLRAALVVVAQLLGGIAAAGVASAIFPIPLTVGTRLGRGTSIAQGLFIEMFLTAMLAIAIIMLAAEKHRATFVAPLGIGLAFFLTELIGIPFTGGSLNPARSLGPDVVNRSFPGYHWIYWLGPALGSLIAVGWYWFLRALRFQTCNPGQDNDCEREVLEGESVDNTMSGAGVVSNRKGGAVV
ncbi:hypothetical protein ACJ72_02378 [Emergomyces africanus]|uniref:Aquaporin n=1 Tax=Emergomyces africanus TaxID=1955775 RepID=A0A1B7P332_9EURO|nr:hypothetical protein ACJ72_02378 [Emergomyces africanus]